MKLYIVYDCVTDTYSVMSKEHKDRIIKEFGDTTTLGRIYPFNEILWHYYKQYNYKRLENPSIIRRILNYFFNKPY